MLYVQTTTDGRIRPGSWSHTGSCNTPSRTLDGTKALTGVWASGRSQSWNKDWNWIWDRNCHFKFYFFVCRQILSFHQLISNVDNVWHEKAFFFFTIWQFRNVRELYISCFLYVLILPLALSCLTRAHSCAYYCCWGDRAVVAKQLKVSMWKSKLKPRRNNNAWGHPYAHSVHSKMNCNQIVSGKISGLQQIEVKFDINNHNSYDFCSYLIQLIALDPSLSP